MPRKFMALLCVALLASAGCARKSAHYMRAIAVDDAETNGRVGFDAVAMKVTRPEVGFGSGGGYGVVFAASKFIAVRHKLEIVEPGSSVTKSIDTVVAYCATIQCEVLSSSVTNETAVLSPAGNIAARVAPQDFNKFLDFAGKQGKISQHSTESEDKTAAVIDVEAKIKNQTDFRDSLRKMLARPGVSVADLLQIQEKLAEAQAELDSEATQRKMLANETEKIAVEMTFRSEQVATSRSAFASVGQALHDFGSVLSDSLAALITFIAALIPWLILIIPGTWLLVKLWRRFRRNRKATAAAPDSSQPRG
jgi:uncharacterized protein DUF4349